MAQPQSVPAMTEALHAIRRQRAGSMTEAERKEIYQLISAAASALSDDDRRKGANILILHSDIYTDTADASRRRFSFVSGQRKEENGVP